MKRQFTYLMLTAGLSAMLGSLTVSAQQNELAIANVPFAFQANDTTLAAGRYDVLRDPNSRILQMRDAETGKAIFVRAHPADDSKVNKPRLVFTCSGSDCVLSTIYMADKTGYAVYKSSHEDLTRKIGLSTSIRSVSLTTR